MTVAIDDLCKECHRIPRDGLYLCSPCRSELIGSARLSLPWNVLKDLAKPLSTVPTDTTEPEDAQTPVPREESSVRTPVAHLRSVPALPEVPPSPPESPVSPDALKCWRCRKRGASDGTLFCAVCLPLARIAATSRRETR